MKNALLILNVLLLVAVVYLFFKTSHKSEASASSGGSTASMPHAAPGQGFRIAYFEMDSIENNCEMVRDVKSELNKKEEISMTELARMDQQIRDKASEYQGKASTMTQAQGEMAQQDLMQRQQKMQSRKQELDQEYQSLYMRLNTDMKKKIEAFLKEYNRNGTYAYIFAYDNGLFFYQDSAYNITGDVVKGLNEMYKKQKKN
ncbi:MAG TPA: OmpH family outer membrane protein [Chitinophagaceae bacterium]|nr:OmpH family outer membrane protein [Chitinophagaceae bacterium]